MMHKYTDYFPLSLLLSLPLPPLFPSIYHKFFSENDQKNTKFRFHKFIFCSKANILCAGLGSSPYVVKVL